MSEAITLYESIKYIRHTAKALFEKCQAKGLSPHDISDKLRPLQMALEEVMIVGVGNDLAGTALAIRSLEADARGHFMVATQIQEKGEDCLHHAEKLKHLLAQRMKHEGVDSLEDKGMMATLTEKGVVIS